MAIVVAFNIPGMTADQYDKGLKQLDDAGAGSPDGRLYHVAAPSDGGWFVTDVWESPEKFEKFGETLIPILQGLGVTPAEPTVYPVHNIVKG